MRKDYRDYNGEETTSRYSLLADSPVFASSLTVTSPKYKSLCDPTFTLDLDYQNVFQQLRLQCFDCMFCSFQIHLDCAAHVSSLDHLLDSLAPIALRPADVILKAMFASVHLVSNSLLEIFVSFWRLIDIERS